MNTIQTGKYLHYKGNQYEVMGEVVHSETKEVLVLYKALYDTPEYDKNTLWVRPKEMFLESILIDGQEVQRFTLNTR